ncbi:helix-turn-helix domain-containing protein [Carnobacterium maltaromaticum]|uniref:helix-turn-helix domain-containing protein n=1 Tax=Carnobacterium maltaromaticum TaxID=2751 RepID=UPI0039AF0540
MNTGQRIAELRKSRGMSQGHLAKALNVSTSAVGMWETGKRGLKEDTALQIAEYFNVTTDFLLGRENSSKKYFESSDIDDKDNNVKLIASHIDDDVTEEDMEDILKYIELIKKSKK